MLTLEDISARIGGALEGNPRLSVSGPSEPKLAQEKHLALALSDQYIKDISLGKAKAALFTKREIGRAHVRTPVTSQSRMPSSA